MKKPWQTLDSKIEYQNPFWQARKDRVIRPDGEKSNYYVLERGDYVMIIAFDQKNQNIYLVRQWRYPLNEHSWEIPAGFIDKNETPLEAAKRELREETGLKAEKWRNLGQGYVSPGLTKQAYYIFLAEELTSGEKQLEGSEKDMIVKAVPLAKIDQMILLGELRDGTTIDGLYRLELYLKSLRNY